MTTLATDDFNRGNAANLGANWTAIDTTFAVNANQAEASGLVVFSDRYTGVTFPNDQWAQCTLKATVETQSDQGSGPCVRLQAGGNMYLLQCNTVESRIYRRLAGPAYQQLGIDGPAFAANDVAYIEIQGTQIIAKKNGTVICGSPTDNNILTGNAGLFSAPLNFINELDDFSAGDFTVSGSNQILMGQACL